MTEQMLIPPHPPDLIDKSTLEIKQDEEGTVYKDLESLGDDLPDHSPRFILLSYPCTLVCSLLAAPLPLSPIQETLINHSPLVVSRFHTSSYSTYHPQ